MTTKRFATLAVLSAATLCSTSYADVGWMDGDTTYSRLGLAGSSAEAPQALSPETSDIGPRGVFGSRYSARTREEVTDELKEHRRTHPNPLQPGDLYYGG